MIVLKDFPATVRYAVLVLLSVGLPIALYHLIEAPMLSIGARLAERLPKQSKRISRAAPPELLLPTTTTAGSYGASHSTPRSRAGHALDHRPAKTAPARFPAN